MTAATGTSRVRSTFPTTIVRCTVLAEGYQHLIEARPENAEIVKRFVGVHGTGGRYAPMVTFKNGETRRLIMGRITDMSDERICFEATMANGNELVRVSGSFSGTSGGHVEIMGSLG